jgi:hypothetical protein
MKESVCDEQCWWKEVEICLKYEECARIVKQKIAEEKKMFQPLWTYGIKLAFKTLSWLAWGKAHPNWDTCKLFRIKKENILREEVSCKPTNLKAFIIHFMEHLFWSLRLQNNLTYLLNFYTRSILIEFQFGIIQE